MRTQKLLTPARKGNNYIPNTVQRAFGSGHFLGFIAVINPISSGINE
jgi:hypothetical protein